MAAKREPRISCVAPVELAAYNITVNAIAPGFNYHHIGGGHAHTRRRRRR